MVFGQLAANFGKSRQGLAELNRIQPGNPVYGKVEDLIAGIGICMTGVGSHNLGISFLGNQNLAEPETVLHMDQPLFLGIGNLDCNPAGGNP